jgi:hypothetical protein
VCGRTLLLSATLAKNVTHHIKFFYSTRRCPPEHGSPASIQQRPTKAGWALLVAEPMNQPWPGAPPELTKGAGPLVLALMLVPAGLVGSRWDTDRERRAP